MSCIKLIAHLHDIHIYCKLRPNIPFLFVWYMIFCEWYFVHNVKQFNVHQSNVFEIPKPRDSKYIEYAVEQSASLCVQSLGLTLSLKDLPNHSSHHSLK